MRKLSEIIISLTRKNFEEMLLKTSDQSIFRLQLSNLPKRIFPHHHTCLYISLPFFRYQQFHICRLNKKLERKFLSGHLGRGRIDGRDIVDGSFYCYHMLNDVLQDLGSMFSTENPGQQPKVSSIVSQHAFYVSMLLFMLSFSCCKYLFIGQVIALKLCKQLEDECSFFSHFNIILIFF